MKIILGALFATLILTTYFRRVTNESDSLPILSAITVPAFASVRRGDVVVFCPPEPIARLAISRKYVEPGSCPGGSDEFLKIVAATSGETVAVGPLGVVVDGKVLPHSRSLMHDSRGRAMPSSPITHRVLHPGEVWLYGSNPRSLDSRYFGPLLASNIDRKAIYVQASGKMPDLR